MEANKSYYLDNLKNLSAELDGLMREFNSQCDRLNMQWTDQRKNEFFNKHIRTRQDDLNAIANDMNMVILQIKSIQDTLNQFG
jgi:hypothetical protein